MIGRLAVVMGGTVFTHCSWGMFGLLSQKSVLLMWTRRCSKLAESVHMSHYQ